MDANWSFAFGDSKEPSKDFDFGTGYFSDFAKAGYADGPAAPKFDDRSWRILDLPHDWAAEAPFDAKASYSHGFKAVGRGFPGTSIGWYRKHFRVTPSDLGRRVSVDFDGVFRDSVAWVNGFYLGRHASGYTGFQYDLTDYLNYDGDNVITVRVDASKEEGWFYEGAGIYRHVWLEKTAPVHIGPHGTFVTVGVSSDSAEVSARTTVVNEGSADCEVEVGQAIVDPKGSTIASSGFHAAHVAAGASSDVECALAVAHPRLWSTSDPALHRLITTVRSRGAIIDRFETPFGIRTAVFDPDHGFFLNGKRLELRGTNVHQDYPAVGIAAPDALYDDRILRLKAMGSNAVRCAHNPPAPEFLDACDRLGMLVIDESRMMGTSGEALGQLESVILRDRNHPSVVLWSIGNEEWTIEGNIKGARVAATVQAFAKRLDPTRRVTAAISGGWGGISSVIDVAGYNYIKQSNSDRQHAEHPLQPGVGTEESTTRQTRGVYSDDPVRGYIGPAKDAPSGGNMELGWQYYAARPYLAGIFFWTGYDYRGEPEPYGWPQVMSHSGILDLCGNPKDGFYYLKSWWTDEPVVHLSPHWNWPGREGQTIVVGCYSNCDQVELLLNGTSLGSKPMPRNGHLEWSVAYRPGLLEARGTTAGMVVATSRVETSGKAERLMLVSGRASMRADGRDVSLLAVSAVDGQGRPVPTADNVITFRVRGGKAVGVGNGDPSSHEPEVFVDSVHQISVEDWRGRIAPAGTSLPGSLDALEPLPRLGNWKARLPSSGEIYDLAATFTVASSDAGNQLRLFLPSLGKLTSIWLNGEPLLRAQDTASAGPAAALDPRFLKSGPNLLRLLVVPFGDKTNHMPEITRLGAVQVTVAAPAPQRHLFNGLANVLVRGDLGVGAVTVDAEAEGLAPAEYIITAFPVPASGSSGEN